jgi:hypothetical protein
MLFLVAILASATGYVGGAMVFGLDYHNWPQLWKKVSVHESRMTSVHRGSSREVASKMRRSIRRMALKDVATPSCQSICELCPAAAIQ